MSAHRGRTTAIMQALVAELERRREDIDDDQGLRSLTLSVKLTANSGIRAVVCTRESETAFPREG